MSVPDCPRCGGQYLDAWRWQHRATCPLLAGEDATRAADVGRLGRFARSFTRPSTSAELELVGALGRETYPLRDATTTVMTLTGTGSVTRRVVDGIDPTDPATWPNTTEETP